MSSVCSKSIIYFIQSWFLRLSYSPLWGWALPSPYSDLATALVKLHFLVNQLVINRLTKPPVISLG